MKPLNILFASLTFFTLVSGIAPQPRTSNSVCIDNELVWDGGANFVLGVTTPSELYNETNWESGFREWGNFSCASGTTKICKVRILYCYYPFMESDPLPTSNATEIEQSIQYVIDEVWWHYNSSGSPSYFPTVLGVYEFTFVKNGNFITIQVITKN
jgi:hypothetical protein